MTTLRQSINDDSNVWRELDKKLDAESRAELDSERFNNLCLDAVRGYIISGCENYTVKDLIWEALSESFDDKYLGTAGVDLLIKQAMDKELNRDGASNVLLADIGRILLQGVINYQIKQAADDVANDLNLCSCNIDPDQYIIKEAE